VLPARQHLSFRKALTRVRMFLMKSAMLQATSRFLFVTSLARNRIRSIDPDGVHLFLLPDTTNAEIGTSVRRCLSMSREVSAQEMSKIIGSSQAREADWARLTAQRFGYSSPSALYKDIASCDIKEFENSIRIEPSNHSTLREWSDDGLSERDWVVLKRNASDERLGSGCRIALCRCISHV
jgi:hypothetical protein